MMTKINFATYNEVARVRSLLNRFIRQATTAKTQIDKTYLYTHLKQMGIGNNIDILA
ncbi:MAG: hypothetical protein MJB14_07380 [Spirochaetes bacterium]|nr:hypothetical protein [Spirochaetota bacterium]